MRGFIRSSNILLRSIVDKIHQMVYIYGILYLSHVSGEYNYDAYFLSKEDSRMDVDIVELTNWGGVRVGRCRVRSISLYFLLLLEY